MMRKLMLMAAGTALTVLGLIGLVLPIVPGVLPLAAAAVCFSMVSPRFQRAVDSHLRHHPRLQRIQHRWRAGRSLRPRRRLALGLWLALGSLMPARRR